MNCVMKRNVSGLVLVVLMAALCAGLFAFQGQVRAAEEGAVADRLHELMETINDNYKTLARTARRKNFDAESIKQAEAMVEAAAQAMHLEPPMAKKMDDDAKSKFILAYRKKMKETVNKLMELEIALMEGKADEAAEMITALNTLKKEGHDEFVEE